MRDRSGWRLPAGLLLLVTAPLAAAAEPFVFATANQGALARHAPLPAAGGGAVEPGAGLTLDWTSEHVLGATAREVLRLDGETVRLGLRYRAAWAGTVFGAELPLLVTGGGTLDSMIENWHDWFGLPNGGREQIPRDEYRYRYARDGVTVFDFGGSDATVGDLRLDAARCGDSGGCWRALLQLPTADADRLLGGGLGLSLWYERGYALGAAGRWSGAWGLGAAGLRTAGPLEAQQNAFVPFGWLSIGYALTQTLDAGVQYYGHGALHDDSDLDAISQAGGQLVFGFRYRAPGGTVWRLALQEDVVTESSPDFVIHLSVDWH